MELKGKIINFLGDSITEGKGVSDVENNRYDNILKREYGLKAVYNYGIGGTRYAHQTKPSLKPRYDLCFCGRAYNLNPEADIIVVFGGVNDYLHGDAPIGNWGDDTPATFYGAVRFLMSTLKTNYENETIIFITSAHMYYDGIVETKPSTRPSKLEDALPLLGYINIVKQTAKEFDIPVLDMFENLGIDPNKQDDREKYTIDGLHFNDEGHYFIAKAIGKFLESL